MLQAVLNQQQLHRLLQCRISPGLLRQVKIGSGREVCLVEV